MWQVLLKYLHTFVSGLSSFQLGLVFGLCLWSLGVVLSNETTVLSLAHDIFMSEYLPFLYSFLKAYFFMGVQTLSQFFFRLYL